MAKNKLPTNPQTRSQLLEHLQNAVKKHQEITESILDCYRDIFDDQKVFDSLVTEFAAADVYLSKALNEVDETEIHLNDLIEYAQSLSDLDSYKVMDIFKALPETLQNSFLEQAANETRYSFVRTDTFAQREALEEFVTTNMYPHYNEQQMYFI